MQLYVLPETEFVGAALNALDLKGLLSRALGDEKEKFLYMDIVHGTRRSGRILFTDRIAGISTEAIDLPRPYDPTDMAKEFFKSTYFGEPRYDPPLAPTPQAEKGWKVHSTRMSGKVIVVVWAAWVMPRTPATQ